MAKSKLSPMMQQYLDIKEKHKDAILFFRLGDFYEMFFDDAVTASRELELTLTGKQCGLEERAPMCGVPFHAAETYIAKLIDKGFKIAICEQTEDPAEAKGLVKRQVVQIVTPGTIMSGTMLKENENNYIASAFADENNIGLSYCDVSTGGIRTTMLSGKRAKETMVNELVRISAKEVILNKYTADAVDLEDIRPACEACFNIIEDSFFRPEPVRSAIERQFSVKGLHGIGLEENSAGEYSLGSLLLYLIDTQKNDLSHIRNLSVYSMKQHMSLDKSTLKNLEITETLFEKKLQGSLLGVLDRTGTAMGSRMMKQWLREPLNSSELIKSRLDAVDSLLNNVLVRNNIREMLKQVYDFERLAGRIATGKANGRDFIALKNSCLALPDIRMELESLDSMLLSELHDRIHPLNEVYEIISKGIVDEPPFTIKEGGIIRRGYSQELDELKDSISDARSWIASLEASERERTGIKNLKVGFNKVFGYYLEVTKSYYDLIPEDYIRKQTLVNCERFVTPQLKETERLVLNAEADINRMEYDLFCQMRDILQNYISEIQSTSSAIAALDVLAAFALVSERNNYVKPEIDDGDMLVIENGRHPVIEKTIRDGIFVNNDTYLDRKDSCLLLITGPNMSGKSTYMRQTALIVLIAQTGCFVPAQNAHIGICDRIYTRIGASDNLSQGQSTFFVEMNELSYILNTATSKSLIILDEIGRGTSTYDGLAIAWAAAEFICHPERKIRTLFATHYHEMTILEDTMEGIRNLNVDVSEDKGNIVFLHKIVEGSASRSYGIHVAKLAGAPEELLVNARIHLESLNNDKEKNINTFSCSGSSCEEETQLSFFDQAPNAVLTKLRNIDLMNTTPSEALRLLEEIRELI